MAHFVTFHFCFPFQEVSTSSIMKNISMTSKQIKITEEPLLAPDVKKFPSVPPPSRFIRSEYRGSETESDFESRSMPHWRAPHDSDSDPHYRPVVFAPTKAQQRPEESQQKHACFHQPTLTRTEEPTWQTQTQTTYLKGTAGKPVHNAIETTNSMQMHEKSETNQRVVNMQSTTKIINFNNQLYGEPEPFPFTASQGPAASPTKMRLAPPPTPTKFVKGELRESDYDSEVESSKIRPVWTPIPSDSDEPHYRRVNAPRSTSCPRSQQQAPPMSPLDFDREPPYQPEVTNRYSTQTLDRSMKSEQHHHERSSTMRHVQTRATEMADQLKMKAHNFIGDFEKRQPITHQQPQLQNPPSNEPQVYRDGSRVSQYGESKKQIANFPYNLAHNGICFLC